MNFRLKLSDCFWLLPLGLGFVLWGLGLRANGNLNPKLNPVGNFGDCITHPRTLQSEPQTLKPEP